MLCCLQQLYCSKGIYLARTEPRGGQWVWIVQQSPVAEIKQCCWTTSSSTWLQRTKEESPVAFPLGLSFGRVLGVGWNLKHSPFYGKQFSLLHSLVFISLIIFLKILNCSRVESSEAFFVVCFFGFLGGFFWGGGGEGGIKGVQNNMTIARIKMK